MKSAVHRRPRRGALAAAALILMTAGGLQFLDVNPAASQTAALPSYEASSDPGLDPADAVWHEAVSVRLPLSAQAAAYAAGGGGVAMVTAKSLHYKDRLYLRVEWKDSTNDKSTTRVEDFTDAVAIEFPAGGKATIPSLCMGQADAAVNIWQWRADSQAGF